VSAVYSAWAIWGAGREAALWGLATFLIAFPIYGVMLWGRRGVRGVATQAVSVE
jgi:hypothetical protein